MSRFNRYVKRDKTPSTSSGATMIDNPILSRAEEPVSAVTEKYYDVPFAAVKKAVKFDDVVQTPDISIQKIKAAAQGDTEQQKLAKARAVANENMAGHFFIGNIGNDKVSVRHLKNSESVITKDAPQGQIGNAYTNIRAIAQPGGGLEFSVIAGASQAPNKVKTPERLKDEAAMHVAQAIFAHRMQFELNNRQNVDIHSEHVFGKAEALPKKKQEEYQGPSIIVVNNYMTDGGRLSTPFGTLHLLDEKKATPRKDMLKKITQELAANSPEGAAFQQSVAKYLQQMSKDQGISLDNGAAQEIVQKSVTADALLFQQQGVNAARDFGKSSDANVFGPNDTRIADKAREIAATTEDPLKQAALNNLVSEYEKTRQKIIAEKPARIAGSIGLAFALAIPYGVGFVGALFGAKALKETCQKLMSHCSGENDQLHKEALKLVLISKMDGASVSGCVSAKDRMGTILAMARAQEHYMSQNEGRVAAASDTELQKMFAKEWLSGQLQYVCDVNAPGAAAVKNPEDIIPPAFRAAIRDEVKQQLAEADKIEDLDKKLAKKQQLIMLLPEVSHAVSNLNKYPEKGDKVASKITKVAEKALSKIEKERAKEEKSESAILSTNPSAHQVSQTTLENVNQASSSVEPPLKTLNSLSTQSRAALSDQSLNVKKGPGF